MYFLHTKTVFFSIILFSLFSFNVSNRHPLHVSTTEITYNSKEKSLEIVCKLFTDDFENALRKQNKTKIDLTDPILHKEMDLIIKKYIQTNLNIKIENQKQTQKYIGYEIDREVLTIYMEIESSKPFKKITISNSILYDFFEDQMNIMHVELLGERKSGRLNNPDSQFGLVF